MTNKNTMDANHNGSQGQGQENEWMVNVNEIHTKPDINERIEKLRSMEAERQQEIKDEIGSVALDAVAMEYNKADNDFGGVSNSDSRRVKKFVDAVEKSVGKKKRRYIKRAHKEAVRAAIAESGYDPDAVSLNNLKPAERAAINRRSLDFFQFIVGAEYDGDEFGQLHEISDSDYYSSEPKVSRAEKIDDKKSPDDLKVDELSSQNEEFNKLPKGLKYETVKRAERAAARDLSEIFRKGDDVQDKEDVYQELVAERLAEEADRSIAHYNAHNDPLKLALVRSGEYSKESRDDPEGFLENLQDTNKKAEIERLCNEIQDQQDTAYFKRNQQFSSEMVARLVPGFSELPNDAQAKLMERVRRGAMEGYREQIEAGGDQWSVFGKARHDFAEAGFKDYLEQAYKHEGAKFISERNAGDNPKKIALMRMGFYGEMLDNDPDKIIDGLSDEQVKQYRALFHEYESEKIARKQKQQESSANQGEAGGGQAESSEQDEQGGTKPEGGEGAKPNPDGGKGTKPKPEGEGGKPKPEGEGEPNPKPEGEPDLEAGAAILKAMSIERSGSAIDDAAWQEANKKLDRELAKGGFIKRKITGLWKGRLFRGYYETKYQREIAENYRQNASVNLLNDDGTPMTREQLMQKAKTDAMYGMMLRMCADSDEYVQKQAGESRKEIDKNSEEYKMLTDAMRKFATKGEDGKWMMNEASFNEQLKRVREKMYGDDASGLVDNYEAIAKYVRGQVEHGESLDAVMEGFKMYRAKAVEGARTQAELTKIEQIVNKYNHSAVGKYIPPEFIAGAIGAAGYLTSKAFNSGVGKMISFGGTAIGAGILAAAKEGTKVKIDQSYLARELAMGDKSVNSKYNKQLEETIAGMRSAEAIGTEIRSAIESGDTAKMMDAYNEILARKYMSDISRVDLIKYSSRESMELERMQLTKDELDLAATLIAAKQKDDPSFNLTDYKKKFIDNLKALENGSENRDGMPENVNKLYDELNAKDKALNKLRRNRAIKAGLATTVVTAAASMFLQEGRSLFDNDTQGIIEGATGQNTDAANETLLETLRGRITNEGPNVIPGATVFHDALTPEEISDLEAQGYTVDEQVSLINQQTTKSISVNEAVQGNEAFSRAGWFNNNTNAFDGNELRLYDNGGGRFSFDPSGTATAPNGMSLGEGNIMQLAENGQIHLKISPSVETQGNPFDVIGRVEGGNIVFDAAPGSPAADLLANGDFAFAEVVDTSTNMVMATEVGPGTDTITTVVNQAVEQVTGYNVTAPSTTAEMVAPFPVTIPHKHRPPKHGNNAGQNPYVSNAQPNGPDYGGGIELRPEQPSGGEQGGTPEGQTDTGGNNGRKTLEYKPGSAFHDDEGNFFGYGSMERQGTEEQRNESAKKYDIELGKIEKHLSDSGELAGVLAQIEQDSPRARAMFDYDENTGKLTLSNYAKRLMYINRDRFKNDFAYVVQSVGRNAKRGNPVDNSKLYLNAMGVILEKESRDEHAITLGQNAINNIYGQLGENASASEVTNQLGRAGFRGLFEYTKPEYGDVVLNPAGERVARLYRNDILNAQNEGKDVAQVFKEKYIEMQRGYVQRVERDVNGNGNGISELKKSPYWSELFNESNGKYVMTDAARRCLYDNSGDMADPRKVSELMKEYANLRDGIDEQVSDALGESLQADSNFDLGEVEELFDQPDAQGVRHLNEKGRQVVGALFVEGYSGAGRFNLGGSSLLDQMIKRYHNGKLA